MSSSPTTADVEPQEVTQHVSSEDEDGLMTSDVTSDEYSSRISVLQNQLKSLRASYAVALQDREDAETQEMLYNKRLDAEMHKPSVMKNEMRAIENSKAELHRTLNQLEADIQQESCSMPEHALMKEELVELKTKHQQLEKQHKQQALMLQEFQNENATLEGRLSNIGTEKPTASVTESGRLLTHVASMQRRATMNAETFTPVAADCGVLTVIHRWTKIKTILV